MKINWSNYVDHIYTISFTPNYPNRINKLNEELKFVDIKDSGIYSIFYNIKSPLPFYELMYNNMNHSISAEKYGEYVNKTFAHYKCIREAYELHYDHILILEDDVIFLKNKKLIKEYMDNLPDEYDVILFAYYGYSEVHTKINNYYHPLCTIANGFFFPAFGASMYLMSYEGMEKWLNQFENVQFTCIDWWQVGFTDYSKLYKSIERLSIQYNDIYTMPNININIDINNYGMRRNIYEHYEILKWCANHINNEDVIGNYVHSFFPSWAIWIKDGTYDYENFEYKNEVNEYFDKVKNILYNT